VKGPDEGRKAEVVSRLDSDAQLQSAERGDELARQAVEFLENFLLVHRHQLPMPELSAIEGFDRLLDLIRSVKNFLFQFSNGQFLECEMPKGGILASYIKALRSNIRHLVWQCNQVASGDLNQQLDFMGELSQAFNCMVEKLAENRRIIENKQAELFALNQELCKEIKRKEELEATLRASEDAYRQKALHDSLTGIYNRGYFFETITREMENLKRRPGKSACLVMVDIDHFKMYNDTYGHLLGDQAIKSVADTISKTLRKGDILARYGGEEFVLFLDGVDLESGMVIAERIRELVENQPNPAGPEYPPITISLGLYCLESRLIFPYSNGSHILYEALNQADAALYEAKEKGRNQVRHAASLPQTYLDSSESEADFHANPPNPYAGTDF